VTEGARMLGYETALHVDLARRHPDAAAREVAQDWVELTTPLVKAYLTDSAVELGSLAVQVYGGHGYIREHGVEQAMRDAKILCLYEGTNGIQAMDLVGRKLGQAGGANLQAFLTDVTQFVSKNADNPTNAAVTFTRIDSPQAWETRAQQLRRQAQVATGLWPTPTRTPLEPVVHNKVDRDDYTVEKVYFQSIPGHFVTGSLYRPKGKEGKHPAVLCPHGHWNNGRFVDFGEEGVKKELVQGAERFEEGGRSPLQARCVQLARMGCVVFHYDMLGYADSVQIPMEIAHGFKKQRPEMNTVENWGLFSPQAEAHLQSVMGLQTWNSIRALDFLLQLPDVDGERIGCTGASGGGTQTFVLGALDSRVQVAFPAVMVSTAMQGGCTCENASLLRVGTGNIEFAALFAPKPLGMTAANDWTKEMETKGFPELKQHYALRRDRLLVSSIQVSNGQNQAGMMPNA